MTAIQIKHNRVVALCGGALLLYAGFRHHIRAPNPLLESGHHVPSSVRDLRLTEMMLIPAIQSTVTPDMPSTVFVARQARFIVDKSKLNRPQPPPPHATWQKCVSGSDAGLCVVAHLLLTWADSNMRALGCAIGIATSVERSNLVIVRRFEDFGWCHQDPCSQSSNWWCKAPILGTEECSLIANAAESFTGVTPQLEDLQESLSDSGVNDVDRFGDLCMNWTADYAIRLAHTLLTLLAQRPSTLSPPDSRAVARLLQEVRTSLSTQVITRDAWSKHFSDVESILHDPDFMRIYTLVADGGVALQSSKRTFEANRMGFSLLEVFKNQQARVSPGPLTPRSTIKLNSGIEMPLLGLGTGYADCFVATDGSTRLWESESTLESVANPKNSFQRSPCDLPAPAFVASAIVDHGVRMVDTAALYGSEQRVFEGVRRAIVDGVPRNEIFVMTKPWPTLMERSGVAGELQAGNRGVDLPSRIEDGGLEYVDLYTDHHAVPRTDERWNHSDWDKMKNLKSKGLTRALGVSEGWLPDADIFQERMQPANLEGMGSCRPNSPMSLKMRELLKNNVSIVNLGLYSAGNDPLLKQLAHVKGVTSYQYAVRWSLQMGLPVLIQTQSIKHLHENVNVYGFEITDEEMALIDLHCECGTANELVRLRPFMT